MTGAAVQVVLAGGSMLCVSLVLAALWASGSARSRAQVRSADTQARASAC